MNRGLLSFPLPLALFGVSLLFCLLSCFQPRCRSTWALLSALSAIAGLLSGLVLGTGLEDVLTPFLLLTAVSLWPLTRKE